MSDGLEKVSDGLTKMLCGLGKVFDSLARVLDGLGNFPARWRLGGVGTDMLHGEAYTGVHWGAIYPGCSKE